LIIDGAEVSDIGSHAFFGGGKDASAVEVPEPGSITKCHFCSAPHNRSFLRSRFLVFRERKSNGRTIERNADE
jgi:hypothetical protein